jgi:glucose/arabinose dehydrogenase
VLAAALLAASPAVANEQLAAGFRDTAVLNTAAAPVPQVTMVRFAPNGEVFAAGEDGRVWEYQNLTSATPRLVADLSGDAAGSKEVMDWEDRGLLALAVDPAYPVRPYLYLLYTYNAPPGRRGPVWPFDPITDSNTCPTPPGPATPNNLDDPVWFTGDGCVASGRLTRITIDLRTHRMVPGSEVVLIRDWCDQSLAHSIGDLQFAPDGSLYVSGGAGGIWGEPDYGQAGGSPGDPDTPTNPCGDPTADSGPGPGHPGLPQPSPASSPRGISGAEGGMLRSQSFRRPLDQPATLDGTIARVDPATGLPLADNPNESAPDLDRRRIVAYGLRQPFRFVLGPSLNSSELWVGDVGEKTVEAIYRDPDPLRRPSLNFGWPCYEGTIEGPDYRGISYYNDFKLCGRGVHTGALRFPFYEYIHYQPLYTGDRCITQNGSAITGLAFAQDDGPYPREFAGALFLADWAGGCLWALLPARPGGLPDPKRPVPVAMDDGIGAADSVGAVDLELGPDDALYYVNRNTGSIDRVTYDNYPESVAVADRTYGGDPLTVHFSGAASSAPDPGAHFRWSFGDPWSVNTVSTRTAVHTYRHPGLYTARLTVADSDGNSDTSSIRIAVGPVFSGVTASRASVGFVLLESAHVRVTIERRVRRGQMHTVLRTVLQAPAGRDSFPLVVGVGARRRLSPGTYYAVVTPFYGDRKIARAASVRFAVGAHRR